MSFAQRYCEFINWFQTVDRGADHKDMDERHDNKVKAPISKANFRVT